MFTSEEWEEWLRWKGQWPVEPEDDAEETSPESKAKDKADLPKKKANKNEETIPAESEKKKKKKCTSETGKDASKDANDVDDQDGGNATFARRYQPARKFEAARWQALKDGFHTHVRNLCSTPSSFEVGVFQFFTS